MTGARLILHSRSGNHDVYTLELIFHRFVLAEFNTHCNIARNSASSRAVPIRKTIEKLIATPAFPVEWRQEQKGMSGGELVDEETEQKANEIWARLIDQSIEAARELSALGIHKSIVNRVLETYSYHTVIATATRPSWDNFLFLRDSEQAQPEIQDLARAVRYALNRPHQIYILKPGEWHLPLVTDVDEDQISDIEDRKRISAARCARVSYLTHDGKRDLEADRTLATRLLESRHMSPFDHVVKMADGPVCERLRPFTSFRAAIESEGTKDGRLCP